MVTCWERADLLALVCGVLLYVCHFPIGILGQVWYLIVSIPGFCTLTYFESVEHAIGTMNCVVWCHVRAFVRKYAKKCFIKP